MAENGTLKKGDFVRWAPKGQPTDYHTGVVVVEAGTIREPGFGDIIGYRYTVKNPFPGMVHRIQTTTHNITLVGSAPTAGLTVGLPAKLLARTER
jgi:hypothetical protein